MSDTLQEREDQMETTTTNYDCCKGGDHHMPWCFQAVAGTQSVCVFTGADTEDAEDCSTHRHRIEPITTHQPAARGGGDEWRGQGQFVSDCTETLSRMFAVYGSDNRFIAAFSDKGERDQVVAKHNQHHSLVAERERLRKVVHAAVHVVRSYQYGNSSPDLAEEFVASAAKILNDTMPDNEQRSISE